MRRTSVMVPGEPKALLAALKSYSRLFAPRRVTPGWEHWLTDPEPHTEAANVSVAQVLGFPDNEDEAKWTHDYSVRAKVHAMAWGDGRVELMIEWEDELASWADDMFAKVLALWPGATIVPGEPTSRVADEPASAQEMNSPKRKGRGKAITDAGREALARAFWGDKDRGLPATPEFDGEYDEFPSDARRNMAEWAMSRNISLSMLKRILKEFPEELFRQAP